MFHTSTRIHAGDLRLEAGTTRIIMGVVLCVCSFLLLLKIFLLLFIVIREEIVARRTPAGTYVRLSSLHTFLGTIADNASRTPTGGSVVSTLKV